jgi:hypothetical protein
MSGKGVQTRAARLTPMPVRRRLVIGRGGKAAIADNFNGPPGG